MGCPLVVVLHAPVALADDATGEGPFMRAHRRGRFLGEIGLLSGEPAFLTAVVRESRSVVVVPAAQVRALATHYVAIGDLILRAYLIPRAELIELGAGFRILGSRDSTDTRRPREFAARNRLQPAGRSATAAPGARRSSRALSTAPSIRADQSADCWTPAVLR